MDLKLGRSRLPFLGCYVPRNPLQVQDKNRVKNGDQEQSDEGSDGESADLGIAEGLPERATFEREGKQSKDRCSHGNHHGPNALNPGIRKSTLQWLPLFVHLLAEVEEHDYIPDDDPDEAGNPP